MKKRGFLDCLIDTKEDFERKRKEHKTTPLYTKMRFRCKHCGNEFERSLACMKVCVRPWLCGSCSQSEGRRRSEKRLCKV